jgi:hypothetical protein
MLKVQFVTTGEIVVLWIKDIPPGMAFKVLEVYR